MSKVLTAFGAASLLALTACGGGGSETEANNSAATEELTLPADENAAVVGDTLGDQANALDANLTTDSNLTTDANLTANSADANVTENVANSQ